MIEERLIKEVKKHVSLYDVTATEYRDQNVRRLAWEEIGNNLKMSADKCRNEWNKLRNCFTNSVRRRLNKGNGKATKTIPPWRYSHQMEFLLPFVEVKGTYTNIVENEQFSLECTETTISPSIKTIDETDESLSESSFISEPKPSIVDQESLESPVSVSKGKTENATYRKRKREGSKVCRTANNRLDDIEMFYISMSKIAKRLPKIEEARLRQEVCTLVSNAEIKHLENESSTTRYSHHNYSSSTNSDNQD